MGWSRFVRRRHWDRERADELAAYLEIETQENIARGMAAEEARYAARRRLGNSTLIREEIYRMNSIAFAETLWQDLRYSLRALRNAPVFTATALLSLGLGIGANTAIFTLLYNVLLKPLPVPDPEALVVLGIRDSRQPGNPVETGFSYPVLEALQARNRVFDGPFMYISDLLKLDTKGEPELVRAALVSGNYFAALRVGAERGRTFSEADDMKGSAHPLAVVSDRLWRQRFAADPDAIGRVVRLNGYPVTIIGVMRAGFFGTQVGIVPDIWAPIRLMDRLSLPGMMLDNREASWMPAMARLKPGITRERAEAEGDATIHRIIAEIYGEHASNNRLHLVLLSGSEGLSKLQQQFSKPLQVLMALIGLVLLVACANVANLLLARAVARQKEMAMRLAMGANRARITRQLLTESTLIALVGGVFGVFLAFACTRLLVQVLPAAQNLAPDIDWHVLAFCLAISIVTGILFGLAPAWRTAATDLTSAMKNDAAEWSRSRRLGIRDALLIAQVALAVVLLVGANLFVDTLRKLRSADSGLSSDHVLELSLNAHQTGFTASRLASFYDRLLGRVRALPGVHAASFIDSGLMSGNNQKEDLYPPGYQPRPNEDVFSEFNAIAPGFFKTLGIQRLEGRDFDPRDNQAAPSVAIVNEPYARYFFGNRNPIGQRIGVSGKPEYSMEIVGVVRATKYRSMRDKWPRIVYFPFAQAGVGQPHCTLYVQASVVPLSLAASIRKIVSGLDRDVVVFDVKTLADQIDQSMAQERLTAWLSSFFGFFALALAAIGLYGAISYNVSRRTREIGIRMALGAQRGQILSSQLRQSLLVTLAGMAFGIFGALAATRFVAVLLYGLTPKDPVAFCAAGTIMLVTAVVASYVPASRATKADPMLALRYE